MPKAELVILAGSGPHVDRQQFRTDLDRVVDQGLSMSAGLLDTSVVIDWDEPSVAPSLPDESSISAITLAELAAGPHLAANGAEGARRQARLQQIEATFEPVVFGAAAARSYGQVIAALAEAGRSHRTRVADLLIAATALANGLALYTRNPDDFVGLESLVVIVGV